MYLINLINNSRFDIKKSKTATFFSPSKFENVLSFHKSINMNETPLIHMPALANKLGLKNLIIKDESSRYELNAFKVLGASYAMNRQVSSNPDIEVFCTATDGNHGRAVARIAKKMNRKAIIFVPRKTVKGRVNLIKDEGAKVVVVDGNYDFAVKQAASYVEKQNEDYNKRYYCLVQDKSSSGYEKIPIDIMMGYWTQIYEITNQIDSFTVDVVILQSGVGSWAASVVDYIINNWKNTPVFISVEPNSANCLFESIKKGYNVSVENEKFTSMAGLDCESLSKISWLILKNSLNSCISISDDLTEKAMKLLYNPITSDPVVVSGESGASSLGALIGLIESPKYKTFINKYIADSTVLLINTEGATDIVSYKRIVNT